MRDVDPRPDRPRYGQDVKADGLQGRHDVEVGRLVELEPGGNQGYDDEDDDHAADLAERAHVGKLGPVEVLEDLQHVEIGERLVLKGEVIEDVDDELDEKELPG